MKTKDKAHNYGHMFEAQIKPGKMKTFFRSQRGLTHDQVKKLGYDSVLMVGGNKSSVYAVSSCEIVIYDPRRVRIVDNYPCHKSGKRLRRQ